MILFIALLFSLPSLSFAQESETYRIAFWNVENLFDTQRDSLKQDEEFQPNSLRNWHRGRYRKKLADVSRVITAMGGWDAPALVGLCEVENARVMDDLTRYAPLRAQQYKYVMTESADLRGIDVALLYQPHLFKLVSYACLRPDLGKRERPTRDVLHVTGLTPRLDTLDIFVAHFPSRSGGAKVSEPRRLSVAGLLKAATDSLIRVRKEPRILIMGDFNDHPNNKSVAGVLQAQPPDGRHEQAKLYHLLSGKSHARRLKVYGSYKYQGEWELLDHIIVSGLLLDRAAGFHTGEDKSGIFVLPFLLTDDERFGGKQPFRTYNGMRYQGGYSDHLPVYADFEMIIEDADE